MLKFANKLTAEQPVPQRTPQEEQTRALTLRLEALEQRLAPAVDMCLKIK
jgi:hypothetical protein